MDESEGEPQRIGGVTTPKGYSRRRVLREYN